MLFKISFLKRKILPVKLSFAVGLMTVKGLEELTFNVLGDIIALPMRLDSKALLTNEGPNDLEQMQLLSK